MTDIEQPAEIVELPETFEKKLEDLINRYSRENGSDTPDFILAAYLERCLLNFNEALQARTKWYAPGAPTPTEEA